MTPWLLSEADARGYELRETTGRAVVVVPKAGTPGCVRVFPSAEALELWHLFRTCLSAGRWVNR